MFKKIVLSLAVFFYVISLTGCVTVVDAVSSGPIQTDPSKRSLGTYWDDKKLRTIVAVNIKKADPGLNDSHINVYTYNSVVLLTGEIPNKELRTLAAETARGVNQVRQVYNELQINDKKGFWSRTADNWLQTKIKTKLLAYRDVESRRVKVIAEDNTIYLMGLLTRAQTEKITDVVRTTKGVKKVVRAVEYIED